MEKPTCKIVGEDGNVFNLIGIAVKTLKKAEKYDEALALSRRAFSAGSYDEVLQIIMEYVEVE